MFTAADASPTPRRLHGGRGTVADAQRDGQPRLNRSLLALSALPVEVHAYCLHGLWRSGISSTSASFRDRGRQRASSFPVSVAQRTSGKRRQRGSRPSTKGDCVDNRWLPNQPVHDLQLTCSGVAVVYVLPRKRGSPQTPQVRRMTPLREPQVDIAAGMACK